MGAKSLNDVWKALADSTRRGLLDVLAKQARTSFTKVSGCSKAAKWPPFSSSFQYTILWKRFSAQRREQRMISLGKMLQPVGTSTSPVGGVAKLSQ